ncbi:MAG TPA: hypothetical protein VNA25_09540 [Phycisphaerae bacterium]|nr:hypothetical protein [Phycisphaerae bacterium]
MTTTRKTSANRRIIARPGSAVKARIINSGLLLGELAKAARIARSTLSDYLSGRTRNVYGQMRILNAFNRLTDEQFTLREFWGRLTAREAA